MLKLVFQTMYEMGVSQSKTILITIQSEIPGEMVPRFKVQFH